MATVTTKKPGSPKLNYPVDMLGRVSEGGVNSGRSVTLMKGTTVHDVTNFLLGSAPRRGATLHPVMGAYGAGDVWGPMQLTLGMSGKAGQGNDRYVVGAKPYREGFFSPDHLGQRSRNMSIRPDQAEGRWGYEILDRGTGDPAGRWTARIPVDSVDGTPHSILINDNAIYEDTAAPLGGAIDILNEQPWANDRPVSWLHILGRTILLNGNDNDARRVIYDTGGAAMDSVPLGMTDPVADPTLTSPIDGASTLTAGTYFVRVRWYDSLTGTYSGPNSRTGTCSSVVVSAGDNLTVDIAPCGPPGRATHWEIAISSTTDTPDQYQTVGGLIAIGTTTYAIQADPTSGVGFDYRSVGTAVLYRHANPPTGADLVAHYRGLAFYASKSDTWVCWSEPENVEHFYTDPTDPTSGFNTVDGESLVDGITSPITALVGNELGIYVFFRTGVVVGEGTFELSANALDRDAQFNVLTQNSAGAVSQYAQVVDQDIFFLSPAGPAVFSGGRATLLDPGAIRGLWQTRDPDKDKWAMAAYDVEEHQVWFAWASADSPDQRLDTVCVFDLAKGGWCAPYTLEVATIIPQRYVDDAGNEVGIKMVLGLPYAQWAVYGMLPGDGLDGDATKAAVVTSTGSGATSVTSTGWGLGALQAYIGCSITLVDTVTGVSYYRMVQDHTATQVSFEKTIPTSRTWYCYLGGVPREVHVAVPVGDLTTLDKLTISHRDVPSVYDR